MSSCSVRTPKSCTLRVGCAGDPTNSCYINLPGWCQLGSAVLEYAAEPSSSTEAMHTGRQNVCLQHVDAYVALAVVLLATPASGASLSVLCTAHACINCSRAEFCGSS